MRVRVSESERVGERAKHAEFPQTLYIHKVVVEKPVVMRRMVLRILV